MEQPNDLILEMQQGNEKGIFEIIHHVQRSYIWNNI